MKAEPTNYYAENPTQVNLALERFGFAHLRTVFSVEEIRHVQQALDSLASSQHTGLSIFKREMANCKTGGTFQQQEIIRPLLLNKSLRQSAVFAKCQQLATKLLGAKAHYQYDHAIYKSPRSEAITPWHQDQAYLGSRVVFPSIHFWIPLQKTDSKNGTMKFSERNHTALLPHAPAFGVKNWPLEASLDEEFRVYEIEAALGDLSLHTNFTLHASGQNHSNEHRKAWILHFSRSSKWHKRWLQLKSSISSGAK